MIDLRLSLAISIEDGPLPGSGYLKILLSSNRIGVADSTRARPEAI